MSEFRSGLGELLDYNPLTGVFRWKSQPSNRVRKGSVAGSTRPDGYVIIRIQGKDYLAHRLAYYYITGAWPTDEIDHIDNNPNNNTWANLREATRSENNRNTVGYSSTGIKNVYYREGKKKPYQVKIMVNGERKTIGSFDDIEMAELVASEARNLYHGEYAHG